MDCGNHLEKNTSKIEKALKSKPNCRMRTKNHKRESEFMLKHHFTLFFEKKSVITDLRRTPLDFLLHFLNPLIETKKKR